MNRLEKFFFCLIISITSSSFLRAQNNSVSATGHVFAEVIPVFSAVETSQMNFGRFSPGAHGGEIILSPANTISVLGSVFAGSGLYNAASFHLTGDSDASFTISLPTDPVILKHSASAKTMIVDSWVSDQGVGVGAGILRNGEQTIYVGARLKVGSLQDNPIGVYAGTYSITFDFN